MTLTHPSQPLAGRCRVTASFDTAGVHPGQVSSLDDLRRFPFIGSCAGMCEEKDGLHWAEDHILVEVLDPATLVPVAEGVRGELVLTTLRKAARPMNGSAPATSSRSLRRRAAA